MNGEKRNGITIGKSYVKKSGDEIYIYALVKRSGKDEAVWFSVDTGYEEYLTDERADAFVVGLLMMAMRTDMDIVCEAPVTRRLRYQLNHYLIPMLAANLKGLHPIKIWAEVTDDVLPCAGAVGMYWTDDVNSKYALKKHLNISEQDCRPTHLLITNHGALDEGNRPEALRKQAADLKHNIAEEGKLSVIGVDSNVHELQPEPFPAVSTLLQASAVLALQKLFGVFLKPAAYEFSKFSFDENDCSHYDLATLGCLETDTTVFYSAGGGYSKEQKLKELHL